MNPKGTGPSDEVARWFEQLPDLETALESARHLEERKRKDETERRNIEHREQVESSRASASRLEAWADEAGIRRHAIRGARYGDRIPLRTFDADGEPATRLELGWAFGGESKAHISGVSASLSAPQLAAIAEYLDSDDPWRDLRAFICKRLGVDAPSD